MKQVFFVLVLSLLGVQAGLAQQPPKYFPRGEKVLPVGVIYHPEQVAEKYWDADFQQIARLGFAYVQLGQGAWPKMEPKDNGFDLGWMDRCLDLAARYKLKVVLNPGTTAPPAWLLQAHPELEAVDPYGHAYASPHYIGAVTQPLFRQLVGRFVTTLAKRYGDNPIVLGWLVDMEQTPDYGPGAKAAFQAYMKDKAKGSLDTLNLRWDTGLRSQTLTAWEQIRLPSSYGVQIQGLHQDFTRMLAEQATSFVNDQVEILQRFTEGQFISPVLAAPSGTDLFALKAEDFLSYRYGEQAYLLHRQASVKTRSGIATLPVSLPGRMPAAGALRRHLWHAYSLGADFVSIETSQRLYPLFASDGTTPTRVSEELTRTMQEIEGLKGYRMKEALLPAGLDKLKAALLLDPESYADTTVRVFVAAALGNGVELTVLPVGTLLDAKQYPIALVPSWPKATPKAIAACKAYAQKGGNLFLGYGVGQQDVYGKLPSGLIGGQVSTLTGCIVEEDGAIQHLRPLPGREDSVEAVDGSGRLLQQGVKRQIGAGMVAYFCRTAPSETAVTDLMNRTVSSYASHPSGLKAGQEAHWREGLYIYTNGSAELFAPSLPSASGRILNKEATVSPGDIGVYEWYK